MIDKKYIDTGVKIRKDFLKLSKKLTTILGEVEKVAKNLKEKTSDLKHIKENLEGKDLEEAKKSIMIKLSELESESNRLEKIYNPINSKMDNLRKQEDLLYETIKDKYPNLTDEEIIEEFRPHIEKLK